jgi:amino acid adenylation domain-containing protein
VKRDNIEDIYELSPTQQGMLFHTLYAAESGVYFDQCALTLRGKIDRDAFVEAWRQTIASHGVLRTSFHWEKVEKPLQVVHRQVALPLDQHDWQELSPSEQQDRLQAFLSSEMERGFDLSRAPLMRLALIQTGADSFYFTWCNHHLLLDGWSRATLFREVLTSYEALRQGQNLSPRAGVPYRNYIAWLRQQDLARAENYWRETLRGFSEPTPLLGALPAGDVHDHEQRYEEQTVSIEPETTAALLMLARRHELTLNTLMQGAWGVMLSRYAVVNDVVFGATVSGRPPTLPDVESLVGLFINTLPVRLRVSGNESLLTLLKRLQRQQLEMREYEYSPLVQVQGWSEAPRGVPLFESIVVFENYPIDPALSEGESSIKVMETMTVGRTNYPLTVMIRPGAELTLEISYDCGRFETASVQRMLGHFKKLLSDMAAGALDLPVSSLSLLTESERRELLVEFNHTRRDYPPSGGLHRLFEAQVQRTPGATAVVSDSESLSYSELNERANRLAQHLLSLGVRAEQRVGILVERSTSMVVSLLGALKAGGCYVPLDSLYPAERLAYMMTDAGIAVLLTERRLAASLGQAVDAMQVVYMDEWEAKFQAVAGASAAATVDDAPSAVERSPAATNLGVEVSDAQLAYLIYTSGSTGQPKGVMISHGAVVNLLRAMSDEPGLDGDGRLLAVTTLSFDIAALELFLPLIKGARLVLATRETASDPLRLIAQMEREGISVMQATPATWRMLLEAGWTGRPGLKILCGGEALPADLAVALKSRGQSLWNMYGPTETTIWSLVSEVSREGNERVSIGRPIANTQVYVLDENWEPAPVGVVGELCLGGAGLARGYWQRAELTADKFIPDGFNKDEAGARLYRTGDLARYLESGELEFLGRVDHQVKLRGYRIELGEIEAALCSHEGVRAAVVTASEGTGGEKRLVAYVVGAALDGGDLSTAELRERLRERLPDYMVPAAIVLMAELPLTPNGKVNRKALPAPKWMSQELNVDHETGRTPIEQMVASIWSDTLGVERVGTRDNFFELGGHSLLATRVISRLREAFQLDLPVRDLFESPTVAGLALKIERALKQARGLGVPLIKPGAREGDLPLSFAQQRLWFLDQLEPGSPFYNIPTAVRLSGKLDHAALERAFNEIIRRHETLRTTFQVTDGRPLQVVVPALTIELPVVDLVAVPGPQRAGMVQQLAGEEARRQFNLNRGPLLRAALLQLSDVEHVALVTMHHIISDGWSMSVLVRELLALYESLLAGKPSPLPELPIQYADFALWQREWLRDEMLELQLAYWRRQLAGAPALLELPTDMPRQALQTFHGRRQPFTLPPSLAAALRTLSQGEGSTMFMALLAIFQTLLYRYSRQEDIVIGVPVAGRQQGATEELIGFFVNTLVLRTNLSGEPSFVQLLRRVREVALDAYTHQDVPFEKLVEELQPERNLGHQPLFQVMFVFQESARPVSEVAGLRIEQIEVDSGSARFDLLLNLVESELGVTGHLEFNTDLFQPETITRLLGHFRQLIESAVAHPEMSILELPILPETEQQQLREWNNTSKDYADNHEPIAGVHQLFEAQAARTPDALAVVCGEAELTYRQLNARANQLAHYLIARGVGPDVLVGLVLERSLEMIVGVLGILKAGGCYVPLDPAYPRERLSLMLKTVPIGALVTQQSLVDAFPPHGADVIQLDTDGDLIARASAENPNVLVDADNLFYTIFTSGSTGTPKGVGSPHRCLTNLVQWHSSELCTGARTLQFASLSFDVSAYEIFMCLASGGVLFVIPETLRRDARALAKYLLDNRVEKMILPVGVLQQLAEEYISPALAHSFKEITSAGEQMRVTPELVQLFKRLGSCELFNNYGPSETHVIASAVMNRNPESWEMHPPIGRPIANTEIHILDQRLQPVPVGVAGEVYIGGVALARGYFNRPDLTTERFLPDPFSRTPGGRMYKTGDLSRFLPDGQIEYLGRIDHQVKIRGFRVELGEIETVLGTHPAVRQLVVVAREDVPGDKRLVAYIVPEGEQHITASEGRNFLRDKLPDYMLPAAYVMLDELPLNPNRKVDRRALPAPDHSRPEVETTFIAPRTAAEELVANIWANVLGLEAVGVADNFFELGGHSMLATQVVSRVREMFRVDLQLRSLFQQPTVAGLVGELGKLWGADEIVEEIAQTYKQVDKMTIEEVRNLLAPEEQDVSA